jgi:hypothetical protein
LTDRLRAVRWRRAAIVAALVLAALAVIGQLVLPAIAEWRIRARLDDRGNVLSAEVHAFPAIQLLWGHADRVEVRMGAFRGKGGTVADLLDDVGGVTHVDARAQIVHSGLTTLRDARLIKDGDRITARGRMTPTDVATAFPLSFKVVPVGVLGGALVVRGGVDVAGQVVGAQGRIVASDGQIVVQPIGIPLLGGLVQLTVFADPRVSVDTLTARQLPAGYELEARGHLT